MDLLHHLDCRLPKTDVQGFLRFLKYTLLAALLVHCRPDKDEIITTPTFLVVLGIAQDAGFPQAQCTKSCCSEIWDHPEKHRDAACIALVDLDQHKYWLFDATPDFKDQTRSIESQWGVKLAGIFITHAHVGHYTGLIHLGREITGSSEIPIYVMSRMKQFLETNGPWDQLVQLNNIELMPIHPDSAIYLSAGTFITPFLVPHRDEYSETVGYKMSGKKNTAIYIPDIDKWQKWDRDLSQEIMASDLAFIDGSFYDEGELPGRDISTIPHPLVVESIKMLSSLSLQHKNKVHFIHFNHTNPLLNSGGTEEQKVMEKGFKIAKEQSTFPL